MTIFYIDLDLDVYRIEITVRRKSFPRYMHARHHVEERGYVRRNSYVRSNFFSGQCFLLSTKRYFSSQNVMTEQKLGKTTKRQRNEAYLVP